MYQSSNSLFSYRIITFAERPQADLFLYGLYIHLILSPVAPTQITEHLDASGKLI